jgi:hypothetical protein
LKEGSPALMVATTSGCVRNRIVKCPRTTISAARPRSRSAKAKRPAELDIALVPKRPPALAGWRSSKISLFGAFSRQGRAVGSSRPWTCKEPRPVTSRIRAYPRRFCDPPEAQTTPPCPKGPGLALGVEGKNGRYCREFRRQRERMQSSGDNDPDRQYAERGRYSGGAQACSRNLEHASPLVLHRT